MPCNQPYPFIDHFGTCVANRKILYNPKSCISSISAYKHYDRQCTKKNLYS